MLLRKPGQSLNPRFVAWPLELGLGTHNPRFVAWPLELELGTHNPCFVAWPLELGLGTHNPRFVAWPLELGLGTLNPRFVAWPLELGLGTCNPQECRGDIAFPPCLGPAFHRLRVHQFHWRDMECRPVESWKYVSHVYKVTVAVDMLGNIIWICPLAPGTSTDVLSWDGYGPSHTRGDFFDFELGGHDGAYKGQIHVIVPFIGRKNGTLTARQQCYNDVHVWYRAHIEQPLLGCGIWVCLGTSGVAAPMSCTSQSVFCCILHDFASGGTSVTPPMDHGSMSHLMFGLTKATRPPRKMRQRMRQKYVCCVANGAPPLQFVMSVRSTIVPNVLTPTLVAPMLFVKYHTNDSWSG